MNAKDETLDIYLLCAWIEEFIKRHKQDWRKFFFLLYVLRVGEKEREFCVWEGVGDLLSETEAEKKKNDHVGQFIFTVGCDSDESSPT